MEKVGYKGLTCLKCGAVNTMWVSVATGAFECANCEEIVFLQDVEDVLIKWGRIFEWVQSMPKGGDG